MPLRRHRKSGRAQLASDLRTVAHRISVGKGRPARTIALVDRIGARPVSGAFRSPPNPFGHAPPIALVGRLSARPVSGGFRSPPEPLRARPANRTGRQAKRAPSFGGFPVAPEPLRARSANRTGRQAGSTPRFIPSEAEEERSTSQFWPLCLDACFAVKKIEKVKKIIQKSHARPLPFWMKCAIMIKTVHRQFLRLCRQYIVKE